MLQHEVAGSSDLSLSLPCCGTDLSVCAPSKALEVPSADWVRGQQFTEAGRRAGKRLVSQNGDGREDRSP